MISALITSGTPPDQLYQAWLRNEFELITSVAQLDEVKRVLARPKFQKYVDADEAAEMVAAISQRAIILGDIVIEKRSPDPDDDAILAIAVAAGADLIVSGDKNDMLALREVEGIPIRTPRNALVFTLGSRQ